MTGLSTVGNNLYAVDNNGGLYVITSGEVNTGRAIIDTFDIGTYVSTATDLVGIPFSGLRSGPISFNDGELRQILFGLTASGDIYAFNTAGELQPIFAGGRSTISTGIGGLQGLDFSTLGFNLWHTTNQRGDDPGHGINPLPQGARNGSAGGTSLAFTFEGNAFNSNYPSVAERPFVGGVNDRQDGTPVEDTYNFPGGAKGIIESNPFSLENVAPGDQPTLYFNYFSEVDGNNDRLRVYVIADDGAEHLLASNTTLRRGGLSDDEFDDPAAIGVYEDDINVDVQQLFDNTGSWRQARVPLGEFAGQSNLSLRIEFTTNGITESQTSVRTAPGNQLVQGQEIVVGGEVFAISLTPAISVPAGVTLANNAVSPTDFATVTLDGTSYVLTTDPDGVDPADTPVDLSGSIPVADLTADEVAERLAETIRLNPPANETVTDFDFGTSQDDVSDPEATGNDVLFQATDLPYESGSIRIEGGGQFGDVDETGAPVNFEDVDLLRVEVAANTRITVNVQLNIGDPGVIRFFDGAGNELTSDLGGQPGTQSLTNRQRWRHLHRAEWSRE